MDFLTLDKIISFAGIISYSEYLFLLTLLTSKFNMLDW